MSATLERNGGWQLTQPIELPVGTVLMFSPPEIIAPHGALFRAMRTIYRHDTVARWGLWRFAERFDRVRSTTVN